MNISDVVYLAKQLTRLNSRVKTRSEYSEYTDLLKSVQDNMITA
jgi:hypothetical protein